MVTKIYAVYDTKAKLYQQPICLHNSGVACRAFSDLAKQHESPYGNHPEDFQLWEIGTYDDSLGVIECHDQKTHLIDFADLVGVQA